MTNNNELHRLTLALVLIDKLIEARPAMTLQTSRKVAHSLIVLALTEPLSDCTLEQSAAALWHSPKVQDQLPPWD